MSERSSADAVNQNANSLEVKSEAFDATSLPLSYSGKGFVAFLDILGYRSFLENNTEKERMEEVLQILEDAKRKAEMRVTSEFTLVDGGIRKAIESAIRAQAFSDTIVVMMISPLEILESAETEGAARRLVMSHLTRRWLAVSSVFFFQLRAILDLMFDAGLPMRGAIEYGDYIVKGASFAGKPLARAHDLASSIEMAGCVLGSSALQKIDEVRKYADKLVAIENGVVSSKDIERFMGVMDECMEGYLVPTKNGPERLTILNLKSREGSSKEDVRQMVLESFWKHNKDIPPSALEKALNTEVFIRYCRMARKDRERARKAIK